MPEFAELARNVTRRRSLSVGVASLIALRRGQAADAKKSCSKRVRKKVARTCGRQVDECTAYIAQTCADSPNVAECLTDLSPCCDPLGECDFTGFTTCVASFAL